MAARAAGPTLNAWDELKGTRAIATANFDALLSARRGVERGDVLARAPAAADRVELERLSGLVRRGALDEPLELLQAHHRELGRLPLLAQLHERVCERLVSDGKRRFAPDSVRALRAFGFEPQTDRGQLLDTEERQQKLDVRLVDEARRRSLNLLKAELPLSEDVVSEAAYVSEFCRMAGAQCWQARERICQDLLGSAVPANLSEVTAWRAVLAKLLARPELDADPAKLLRAARGTMKRAEPAARRRQRFIR